MDNRTKLYLKSLIGLIYKILPMYENSDKTLYEYIDSLCIQLVGGFENFEELKLNSQYITIVNIIHYFRTNDYDQKTCKREVLKCTNILNKMLS